MFAGVCWTPFQIMNTLNYKYNFAADEKMDIYICNKFYGARKIAEKLAESEEFENVYFVENIDYDSLHGLKKHLSILSGIVFPRNIINKYVMGNFDIDSKKYEYIVSSGYLNFNVIFTTYLQKKYPETKCFFLDDGMESYLDKNTEDSYSALYSKVSHLFSVGGAVMNVEKLYVYMPELVAAKEKYSGIYKLPSIDDLNLKRYLRDIFQYHTLRMKKKCKVIYFDQLSTGDFHDETLLKLQEKVLQIISEKWDASQWMIKMHPRSVLDLYPKKSHKLITTLPWELFCDDLVDENTILIAISSTACITPKMIYGKEPKVFLLEKIFINDTERKVCDFFRRVRVAYKSDNSFFIPESMEEFQNNITSLEV